MIQKRTECQPANTNAYPGRGLVVEDSRAVRTLVSRFLHDRHIVTLEAADGVSAWEMIQRFSFDIIITDIEMPRWTGMDLVKAMRNSSNHWIRQTPVIVTSTVATPETWQAACEFHSTYFMSKPLSAGQLDVMLRLVATMQRLRDSRLNATWCGVR